MKNTYRMNAVSRLGRRAICGCLLVGMAAPYSKAASPNGSLPIFTFDGENNSEGWRIINDGVMGGKSESSIGMKPNGSLVFKGNVSLKNNGGFASTRSPVITADIGSFDGIELILTGDGNTYKCGLRTDNEFDRVAHQASFNTTAGEELRIRIPYKDFAPTWHGRRLSENKRMNPDEIKTIGFLISDKQEGSFQLEVKSISAYRNGDPATPLNGSDIISVAKGAGVFKTLLAAVEASGLTDEVRSLKGVTLIAPTDEAFAKLPEGTLASLLKPENKDLLVKILTYHIIDAEVPFSTATTLTSATALNGQEISVSVKTGALFLNDSRVIDNDIKTANGIVHVVDSVMLPPENEPSDISPVNSIISSAIKRGVPLFNGGNSQACADIYELAAEALLTLPEKSLGIEQRKILIAALDSSRDQNSATHRAWTMRTALDKTIAYSMN